MRAAPASSRALAATRWPPDSRWSKPGWRGSPPSSTRSRARLDAQALERFAWSDGELEHDQFNHAAAQALRYGGPWGQGFAEPQFDNEFAVESVRVVGGRHLKLRLRPDGGEALDAIAFDALDCEPLPPRVRVLFQLDLNEWNGRESLQLLVRQIQAA